MSEAQRKPAHLERVGGQTPRQRIWAAIRLHRAEFDLTLISRTAKVEIETIRTYIKGLIAAGFVARLVADERIGIEHRYSLARDNGVEAPRVDRNGNLVTQGMGTEQMWRTMQILTGDFDYKSLARLASTAEIEVREQTAQAYIGHLARAGYLIETKPVYRPGRGMPSLPARYRLDPKMVSGPRPPMIQRSKSIYDPNLDRVVWEEVKRDDDF